MSILKLSPACKSYLWGGTKLAGRCAGSPATLPVAESWELSCHPDGPSVIAGGEGAGMTLAAYVEQKGAAVLGENCRGLPEFPILVKLIDAKEALSVQVHPNDAYAFAHEGQQGKTEMWYVIGCEPGAFLYIGFNRPVARPEVERAIEEGRLEALLQKVPVQPGDAFLIKAGTVHAIGAGVLLAEVQQSSNITYRLYDYGRRDRDGRPRPLHIKQALEVANLGPANARPAARYHLAQSDYFVVDAASAAGPIGGYTGEESFTALTIYSGEGVLYSNRQAFTFSGGGSFFIGAGTGGWSILGSCACVAATIPPGLGRRLGAFARPAAAPRARFVF